MKLFLLLGFVSSLMNLSYAESIIMRLPDIEDEFLKVNPPGHYNTGRHASPFEDLSVFERRDWCDLILKNPLYSFHEDTKDWNKVYKPVELKTNSQDELINDSIKSWIPNVLPLFGVVIKGKALKLPFTCFLCSQCSVEGKSFPQLYISSSSLLQKDAAFILVNDDWNKHARVYGLLSPFDAVEIPEKGTSKVIDVLVTSPVCVLKETTKFDLCSKIHYLFHKQRFTASDGSKDKINDVFHWYDQGNYSCNKRKVLVDDDDAPKDSNDLPKHYYVPTLACVFGKRKAEDAYIFVSVKEMGQKFVTAFVMIPKKTNLYDEIKSPLKVLTSFEIELKVKNK